MTTTKLEKISEGHRVRLRYGKSQRGRFIIRIHDEQTATARAVAMQDMANMLTRAGHSEHAPIMLAKAGEADESKFREIQRLAQGMCAGKYKPEKKLPSSKTFRQLAEDWTSGELHQTYPDHVRDISHDSNGILLEKYAFPTLGDLPLVSIGRTQCDEVMRSLPRHLSKNSRRHVAKVINRVLNLGEFVGLLQRNPLPRSWVPSPAAKKDTPVLYPSEDVQLLACREIPLAYRMFYGFLHREGGRRTETASLYWREFDLEHGVVQLDENKTQHARWWKLSDGVASAMAVWYELRGEPNRDELVFVDENGSALNVDHMSTKVRTHLRRAGVARERLFTKGTNTLRFGTHGFRHSFTTRSLANGKTDDWVRQRTGHTTDQLLTYREPSKSLTELNLGEVQPLINAIPELAEIAVDRLVECLRRLSGPAQGGPQGGPELQEAELLRS
ncbi:MAG TPA: tyrosine-type recombinase/integrase [Polyangiaceae bacterium]